MSASRGAERGFERYGDFFRALGGSVLTSVPARGPHADSANSAAIVTSRRATPITIRMRGRAPGSSFVKLLEVTDGAIAGRLRKMRSKGVRARSCV